MPVGADHFLYIEGDDIGETVEFIPGAGGQPRFIRLHGRLADRMDT